MAQWDKLIEEILRLNKNLRFKDLEKALIGTGYSRNQPKGGSSHYIFRKKGCIPISLAKPKGMHMDIVYIRLVKKAVSDYLNEGGSEE